MKARTMRCKTPSLARSNFESAVLSPFAASCGSPARGFQPGHPKYGGKKKGTGNKVDNELRQAIVDGVSDVGFVEIGDDGKPVIGKDGIRGFVRWLGLHHPQVAAALLGRVLPYNVNTTEMPPVVSRAEIEGRVQGPWPAPQ
jgi:hypothetical protein